MTGDPPAPPHPACYGAGLAVLVVGTGAEPFRAAAPEPGAGPSVHTGGSGALPAPPPDRPAPPDLPAAAATAAVRTGHALATVVLVDSRPPGGTPVAADLPVLRIGEDVGRGAAVNRAVAALPVEVGLVAVAPPGLVWAEGALDALRAAAARHPRAGILAPRVRDRSGATVASTHPLPRRGRRLGSLTNVGAVLAGRPWPPADAVLPAEETPVGWSSAPALLLRRAALDSVDGFDPRYPGVLDDLDLADRLAVAGWLTVHVPSATVVYVSPARSDATAARRYLAERTPRPVRALWRATAP